MAWSISEASGGCAPDQDSDASLENELRPAARNSWTLQTTEGAREKIARKKAQLMSGADRRQGGEDVADQQREFSRQGRRIPGRRINAP